MQILKTLATLGAAFAAASSATGASAPEKDLCLAYFTWWENTVISEAASKAADPDVVTGASLQAPGHVGRMALTIAETLGIRALPIRAAEPYSNEYRTLLTTVRAEHERDLRPALRPESKLDDPGHCRVLFLGFPNWDYGLPNAVKTFAEGLPEDVRKKSVVIPFASTGTGGWGDAPEALRAIFSNVRADLGLSLPRDENKTYGARVKAWLKNLPAEFTRSAPEKAPATERTIEVRVDGRTLKIRLNASPEAAQFVKMLPVTVRMMGYGGREYYGGIEGRIRMEGPGQLHFENGTLTYCPTNNTVAIFYAQTDRPNLTMAVYPMGKVEGDLAVFEELGRFESFEFRAP